MKRPGLLFLLLSLLTMASGLILWFGFTDQVMFGRFFIIGYIIYFAFATILLLLFAGLYGLVKKINRPIKTKTGLIHFCLTIIGLIISLNLFNTYVTVILLDREGSTTIPYHEILIKNISSMYFLGPLLIFGGLIVFVFGLVNGLRTKNKLPFSADSST